MFAFDPQACPPGVVNYWGYQPVSFFAPHPAYSSRRDPLGPVDEFRDMVKALHRAGIEVILDVVFNHTAEGDHTGPTLSFRGIDNPTYYILEEGGSRYADYTGCGNTLNANQPIVRRMIVDSLRYWVEEMHVDGFRFDLASILARDHSGRPMPNPPVLWDIESDPGAGRHEAHRRGVGRGRALPGRKLRRRRLEGVERPLPRRRSRLLPRRTWDRCGAWRTGWSAARKSTATKQREAEQSVNFVTCHDGFTLNDLVSYNQKHNEANGEDNRDGANDNRSWNCGVEGPTEDPAGRKAAESPGEEFPDGDDDVAGRPDDLDGRRGPAHPEGNNNAYCQDDQSTWFDWSLLEKHADVHRFVSLLAARRSLRDVEHERERVSLNTFLREANKAWHGVRLHEPDWGECSHSIALGAELRKEGLLFHFILNAYWEPLEFELPVVGEGASWRRWIDTALDSPNDIVPWQTAPAISGNSYRAEARSVVLLYAVAEHHGRWNESQEATS